MSFDLRRRLEQLEQARSRDLDYYRELAHEHGFHASVLQALHNILTEDPAFFTRPWMED